MPKNRSIWLWVAAVVGLAIAGGVYVVVNAERFASSETTPVYTPLKHDAGSAPSAPSALEPDLRDVAPQHPDADLRPKADANGPDELPTLADVAREHLAATIRLRQLTEEWGKTTEEKRPLPSITRANPRDDWLNRRILISVEEMLSNDVVAPVFRDVLKNPAEFRATRKSMTVLTKGSGYEARFEQAQTSQQLFVLLKQIAPEVRRDFINEGKKAGVSEKDAALLLHAGTAEFTAQTLSSFMSRRGYTFDRESEIFIPNR